MTGFSRIIMYNTICRAGDNLSAVITEWGMGITVYADILFAINFSMDYLALRLTKTVLSAGTKKGRLAAAAFVGAFIGSCAILLPSGLPSVISGFASSFLMTYIAFGSPRRLIRDSITLWGIGALLGGLMTLITSLGDTAAETYTHTELLPALALCITASSLFVRILGSSCAKKSAEVRLSAAGYETAFTALADSGCLVTEPISGIPVVIMGKRVSGELYDMLSKPDGRLRIRMIPIDTVSGHTLLTGFIPDKITVNGREVSAAVAVGDGGAYGGYDGIVPTKLLRS